MQVAACLRCPNVARNRCKYNYFRYLRTIGLSTRSRVVLAKSIVDSRLSAVKIIKCKTQVEKNRVWQTNDLVRIWRSLLSPALQSLQRAFCHAGRLYMFSEFIAGGELSSLHEKFRRFPNHVARFYAAEVAQALGSLHEQDIVYRNMHPDNIMLSSQGHVKLVGFGFAKVLRDTDSTRTICGCHDYLAPEVLISEGTTMASDWWSWGVLIYFMLAGTNPFHEAALDKHGNVIEPLLYQNILRCEVNFPHWLGDQAASLIRALLVRDPASRLGGKTGRDALPLIMAHPWFSDVLWETLRDTKAPYIPPADDTDKNGGSLNKYDESDDEQENEDDER
ncbi:kinase-like domain-containing protein [Lasiosphaeria miniovina]|uniref:cAMP-dependent protein kinase n=1 Tax=Lasiosphaeria miniovina TaxID=1954250 RepID=A0AA39ZSS3_9PEZI|nr:kinase-like domain-containing protein [Lasiosphaeria miniovina]KAK0703006.1 kinase-like domain-containing protein [Lasiosphaeria miniovina]